MASLRSPVRCNFRAICRLASVLAYGLSLLIVYYAQPIAAKVYNDLCATQGTTFVEGLSVRSIGIIMIAIAVPLLLSRSNTLVVVNVIISLITVLAASALLSTAGNTPYECFTTSGTYEDHTSGLEGFSFWLVAVVFFSYVLLLIDLVIWAIRKLASRTRPEGDEVIE